MTLKEHAIEIYKRINSFSYPSEMNGIEREWILEKIEEGLHAYKYPELLEKKKYVAIADFSEPSIVNGSTYIECICLLAAGCEETWDDWNGQLGHNIIYGVDRMVQYILNNSKQFIYHASYQNIYTGKYLHDSEIVLVPELLASAFKDLNRDIINNLKLNYVEKNYIVEIESHLKSLGLILEDII